MEGEISEQNVRITELVRSVLAKRLDSVVGYDVDKVWWAINRTLDHDAIKELGITNSVEQEWDDSTDSVDLRVELHKTYHARGKGFFVVLETTWIPEQQRDRDTIIDRVTRAVTWAIDLVEFLDLALVEREVGGLSASP